MFGTITNFTSSRPKLCKYFSNDVIRSLPIKAYPILYKLHLHRLTFVWLIYSCSSYSARMFSCWLMSSVANSIARSSPIQDPPGLIAMIGSGFFSLKHGRASPSITATKNTNVRCCLIAGKNALTTEKQVPHCFQSRLDLFSE